jgi:hypothetical protein
MVMTLLVSVPLPRWAVAEELQVRSEAVGLARRTADRSADEVAVAGLDPSEVAERRGALAPAARRASGVREAEVRALGVTVHAEPDGPVLVRARVDGRWTPWLEVPFAEGEAPDRDEEQTAGLHSEPVWLGDADAYELDAPEATPALEVHTVRPTGTTRTRVPSGAAGAATEPSIRLRSSWGARPPRDTPTLTEDLKVAIVHHTATGNTYSSSQVPAVLRSIQAYHQDVRGYDDIAYNILVDRFGVAWEGRAGGLRNVVLGGHSQGFNTGSVGVSVIGDYQTAGVSAAVFEKVAHVIAWKLALHLVDPRSTVPYTSAGSSKYAAGRTVTLPRVVAHRDVQSTGCPGGNLYARMPALRTRVNDLVPAYQQGRAPELLDLDVTGDGLTDPFEYRPGSGTDQLWAARSSGGFLKIARPVGGTYRPAAGDFNGDGRDDILWHGSGSTDDWMWWSTASGYRSQRLSVGGSYVPVVGDFDGNGLDDVLWYATGLAQDHVWYSIPGSRVTVAVSQPLISGVPRAGDFDGDGRDDVMFHAPGPDADDVLWWSQGRTWQVASAPVAGRYRPAVHDADDDGRDDITWVSLGGTRSYRWRFTAARSRSSTAIDHPATFAEPVTGDFDGDGRSDVLLVGPGSQRDAVWYSNASGVTQRSLSIDGTWATAGGPMNGIPLAVGSPDDVLFVRNGTDSWWRGQLDRTFRATRVG